MPSPSEPLYCQSRNSRAISRRQDRRNTDEGTHRFHRRQACQRHISALLRREPMTGEVISRVPLASKAEVRAAVENAIAAQAAWAATNPQRRGRVLVKFLELVARAWPLKSSSARLTPRKFLIVSLLISMISPLSVRPGSS